MEEDTPFLSASQISKLRATAVSRERTGPDEELEFKSIDDGVWLWMLVRMRC